MTTVNDDPTKANAIKSVSDFDVILKSVSVKDGSGDERPTVLVTASSSEIDLATDRFSTSALKQMEKQFAGMTIFLNHSYRVPEDVFGKTVKSQLVTRGSYTDLDLEIEVETNNARAVDTYNMIKNGTTLGVSVGVLVMDADFVKDASTDDVEVLEITSVYTLEASVVGIPANRRSWAQGALKAASAMASKGGPVKHLSDGTSLIQRANGQVVKMVGIGAEVVEDTKEAPVATDPADPEVVAAAAAAAEVAAAAADPKNSDANHDAAAGSPDAPATAAADDDPDGPTEKAKKPKPTGDDEDMSKSLKSAEFLPDEQKSLANDAAARALCDKLYSLVWSMWDEVYNGFSSDTDVSAKRETLGKTFDEFADVAKRLVDSVIDDYYGDASADDSVEEKAEADVRTSMFKAAFADALKETGIGLVALREGTLTAPAAVTADSESVSRLVAQAEALITKNHELATKNGELEAAVKTKSEMVDGLLEGMDTLMETPMFRKTGDSGNSVASIQASLEERFPSLDSRVLSGVARKMAADKAAIK